MFGVTIHRSADDSLNARLREDDQSTLTCRLVANVPAGIRIMENVIRTCSSDATPSTQLIPLLCFRDMDSEFTWPILDSLQMAGLACGVVEFVHRFRVQSRTGLRDADERFRPIVIDLLRRLLIGPYRHSMSGPDG